MDNLFEYLGDEGIINPPDAQSVIQKLTTNEVVDLAIKCYELTEEHPKGVLPDSIFNFSASGSMSGSIRPCSIHECRIKSIYELSAFSALYADSVLIPNPLEHIHHIISSDFKFEDESQVSNFKYRLIGDLMVLLNLRPLIEEGLVFINPRTKTYCKECLGKVLVAQKGVVNGFNRIKERIINEINKNIKFTLLAGGALVLNRERDYLSAAVFQYSKLPNNLKSLVKNAPHSFSPMEVKKYKLWEPVVLPIFEDLILQKYSMLNSNTAYLTNQRIETAIIDRLDNGRGLTNDRALVEGLIHNLPFIQNVPLKSLVKLRKQEAESFNVYRDNLTKTIAGLGNEPRLNEIRKAIKEEVEPQLHKLDQIVKNHRDDLSASSRKKAVFSCLCFTAGLFVNHISGYNFAQFLDLAGAYKLSEVYADQARAKTVPPIVKNSNYYFLWRLKRKI